tara:strand:+ start:2289 stop:2579 length:291 start_codon:yes stop_codon:yes gene_type:complete
MQIEITGQNIELTPPIHEYITKKLQKIENHFSKIIRIHVVIKVEKLNHIAKASLHYLGKDLIASGNEEDMYAAIDDMADKMYHEIVKHKEKLNGDH